MKLMIGQQVTSTVHRYENLNFTNGLEFLDQLSVSQQVLCATDL